MRPSAKPEMWLALRSNVEVRRVLLRIGPRGFGEQVNGGTPFDLEVVVGEILHRLAGDPGCRRPHAHHFLDRAPRELRPVDEESPLVRILDEHAHRQTKLVARGVDAAEHRENDHVVEFLIAEPILVFVGLQQQGDEVIARRPCPALLITRWA